MIRLLQHGRLGSTLALAASFVAACDGATSQGPSASIAALVGDWEARDARGCLIKLWSFSAEHRYTQDILPAAGLESADHVAGEFRVTESGWLELDGVSVSEKQRRKTSWSYYVSGEHFAPETFVPETRSTGVIGSWLHSGDIALFDLAGTLSTQGHVVQRLELFADGRARRANTVDDHAPEILSGRFEEAGSGSYRVLLEDSGVTTVLSLRLLDDAVLAPEVLTRKALR